MEPRGTLQRLRVSRNVPNTAEQFARLSPPKGRVGRIRLWSHGSLTLLTLLFSACGGDYNSTQDLLPIERLCFVPAGQCEPFVGVHCGTPEDLLVDRYEVTIGQWRELRELSELADLGLLGGLEGDGSFPVVGMDYQEAQAFAEARGMRLPTCSEWFYIAAGSRAQTWPYGNAKQFSVTNTTELGLGRAAAVGTFPGGSSTGTGIFDLVGNVREWCSPPLPGSVQPSDWLLPGECPHPLWAMGGSFQTRATELFTIRESRHFNAVGLEAGHRSSDLGLRCVVSVRAYLLREREQLSDPEMEPRLRQVGRRWGPMAVPVLQELVAQGGAAPCIRWLLEGAQQ